MDFLDAQKLQKENPETFEAPNETELNSIKKGSIVKVCIANERFWVVVDEVRGDTIKATVDNYLIGTEHGLSYGDRVCFMKKNVYDIFPE